ncbi:MAG TPA: ABC transporter permease [Armatimonadota bacterium]|nr:ABC transporter permease [Armatimonadota bacterium]
MTKRLLARVGWGIVTLLGTSVIVFVIAHAIPADPAVTYAGPQADAETLDNIRREMGLDDPLWQQYLRFLGRAARGDLGRSYVTQQPVIDAIMLRFPVTLALSLGGLAIWLAIGVPLGVLTARWRDKPVDRIVLVLCMIGISLPTFWLGRLLQFQLAYRAGLFPVGGFASWQHLILPCVTLGTVGAGYYARLVHSNMVEVMNQDYIRAARAKGLSETKVLFKHALRNAFIPLLTVIGMDTAALLGGVVFTETIFALPGVGSLALQAVQKMDVPMIMGTVLFAATLVVVANIVVDLVYRMVDPRIQRQ